MTAILIILFITFLIGLLFKKMAAVKKERLNRIYKIGDKEVYLTKKDILEISRKNYGTHSWYKKTKRK